MIKSFFTNSLGILLSRIMGFIRDMLMASSLGASIYSDFFIIAFKIPNFLRRIFAEGAFSGVFLPSFVNSKNKSIFSVYILLIFSFIIGIISLLVYNFSYEFTQAIALGLDNNHIKELHKIVAINFFYIFLIFISTFLSVLLHYKKHFFTTSFSTSFLNISIIIAIILADNQSKLDIVYAISYGVIIGGVMQIIAHIVAIKVLGLNKIFIYGFINLKKKYSSIKLDIKNFYNKFGYSIIGASSYQFASFLDIFLASFLVSSSISYLYFANRIFQFPFALFSVALGIVLFPMLSKLIKLNKIDKAFDTLSKSFYLVLSLLVSASIVGIIFSQEIIWLLFERGEFNRDDTIKSSYVLVAYLYGLVPFGVSKIFSLWLYSEQKQKQAAIIATISIISNIIFSLLLISKYQVVGLALASSLSGVIQLVLSVYYFGFNNFIKKIWNLKYSIISISLIILVAFFSYLIKNSNLFTII